jgi:RHS repeat-associated protein
VTTTSADPQRLRQFVEQAVPPTGRLAVETEAAAADCNAFIAASAKYLTGARFGGLEALRSLVGKMRLNEAFVAAVAEALVAADGWAGGRLATVDDAAVARLIAAVGGLADGGYITVSPSVLLGLPPTSGFVDDPVCTATGNFFHHDVDLSFPARSSVLDLARSYNSMAAPREGSFGPGWSSLLDVALVFGATGPRVRLPDGAEIAFLPGEGGVFVPEARSGLRLRHLGERGWELADRAVSGFSFGEDGVLLARWAGPARVALRWDRGLVVALAEEASGRVVELSWEAGRVVAARSSDGRAVSYGYQDGHLVAVERPGGAVRYGIEAGRVASVVDADGVVAVHNTYDEAGRVRTQEAPFGRTSHYTYGDAGVTVVTGPGPDALTEARNAFVHDRRGNLTAMVGADGATLRTRHDAQGRMVGWRDRRGSEWTVAWNGSGTRPLSRRGPEGWEESFEWDDEDRLVESRSPAGVTRYEYDDGRHTPRRVVEDGAVTTVEVGDDDLPRAVTDADGVRVDLAWDPDGQLVSATDALGGRSRFGYDDAGHLTRLTNPSGAGVAYTCDPAGRVLSAVAPRARWSWAWSLAGRALSGTDPFEGAWSANYGAHGAVEEISDDAGRPIHFGYDTFGNTAEIEGPDGRVYRQTHDGLSQLVSLADPAGATWGYEHDPEGAVVGIVEPTGAATWRELDALGRTITETDGAGRLWRRVWGANGRLAEVVDPVGRVTAYGYDEAGRIVEVAVEGIVVGSWSYTAAGRLAGRWVFGGAEASLGYDDAGRLASVTDDEGRLRILSDVDGRVVRAVDEAGRALSVRRDDAGRVVGVVDRKGRERSFELDEAGRLSSMSNEAGASSFTWKGPLLASARDALGATTTYSYDGAGRLSTVTDPLGARTSLAYDQAGRLGAVTDALGTTTSILRDAGGGVAEVGLPGGGGTRRWADASGATLGFSALGAVAPSVVVRRDPAGRLVGLPAVGALRPGPRLRPFDGIGFDGSGRVVASPGGDVFRHDAAGQLVEWVSPAGKSVMYEYDLGGRLVAERQGEATTHYEHDACGRLLRRVGPDGAVTAFSYDAASRRVSEVGSKSSVLYEWDEAGRLVAVVRTEAGVVSRTDVVYDNLGLPVDVGGVAVEWDLTTGWPTVARIGDVSYEWTDEGLVVRRHGSEPEPVPLDWTRNAEEGLDPWGAGPGYGVRLGYRGELAIEGLVFLRARFYDPATRSFLSPDPLPNPPGAPCGANPYHYAWNDPVSFVDPSGMRPLTQVEFERRKHLEQIGHAGQVADSLAKDPWGAIAMGLVIVGGVGLCFMTGGLALGAGMLIGAGISAGIGVASGNFNPRMVALNGLLGTITAGIGNAVTGASIATKIITGAGVGAGHSLANQAAHGGPISWGSVGIGAGIGSLGAGIAGKFSMADQVNVSAAVKVPPPLEDIPESSQLRLLRPDPNGGAQYGVQYKWVDTEDQIVRFRVHGPDANAPPGSHAAIGETYRVQVGGRYMDQEGTLYPRGVHNPKSPNYDPAAANATHIPWPGL